MTYFMLLSDCIQFFGGGYGMDDKQVSVADKNTYIQKAYFFVCRAFFNYQHYIQLGDTAPDITTYPSAVV